MAALPESCLHWKRAETYRCSYRRAVERIPHTFLWAMCSCRHFRKFGISSANRTSWNISSLGRWEVGNGRCGDVLIRSDLGQRLLAHVRALLCSTIPSDRPLQGSFDSEARLPSEIRASFACIQSEKMVFMHTGRGVAHPGCAFAPHLRGRRDDALNGPRVVVGGTKVECRGELRSLCKQLFGERDVSLQRIEHMLPGTNRRRSPDDYRTFFLEAADQVGNETVFRPVAASDHISSARRGQGDMVLLQAIHGEKRTSVSRAYDFRASFARSIGIIAAERVGLSIRPHPLLIPVTLVGGNRDNSAYAGSFADGFEHMRRTHNIGG